MTTEKIRVDRVSMTECPYCDDDLDECQGFADHWPSCSKNPEGDDAE